MFSSAPAPSLFIISNSYMWPFRTSDQKKENINKAPQPVIIGWDVSRDRLDMHCLTNAQRQRLPNIKEGHAQRADLASSPMALVRFEATGGHEWRLWTILDAMPLSPVEAQRLRPTGPTRNGLRASWSSDPMQGAPVHMKRYVSSER